MVGRRKTVERLHAAAAAAVLFLVLINSGCGGSSFLLPAPSNSRRPVTHTVLAGETVYQIAQRYGVSAGQLMTANGFTDPRGLRVGQALVIPGAFQAGALAEADRKWPYRGERESRQFLWPVAHGVVSSGFGFRHGAMHDGVDIAAPSGTPVLAADGGVVIFSGALHGYGNTIIIRHDGDYATVYGHNEVNRVREGERVVRGETIGEIGRSGRTTGANLHFEVRRDNVARNPLAYLPQPMPADGISFAASGGF